MENSELSFQYETTSSTFGKIVLKVFLGILLLIGFLLFGIGFISFAADGDLLEGLKFILPGSTIFFFVIMAYTYSRISSKTKFVKSYFDIVNKRYYLETKSGNSGHIPFNEIDSLAMRTEIVRGNKSANTYYIVYIIKKDGAWWDIFYNKNEITARKKLNELQVKVKFDGEEGAFNLLEEKEVSELFSIEEKEDRTILKWGEQVSLLYKITGIMAVISFIATFAMIASFTNEVGSIGYYLIIGFCIIFGLLIVTAIYKALFGYTDYELEIAKDKITFFGLKKDKRKVLAESPTNEIKFTQYSFNIVKQDIFNGQEIYLLSQEYAEKLNKYRNGDFSIVEILSLLKEIKTMKKNIIKLPFPGFRALDIILFEKKLDEELRKLNPEVL